MEDDDNQANLMSDPRNYEDAYEEEGDEKDESKHDDDDDNGPVSTSRNYRPAVDFAADGDYEGDESDLKDDQGEAASGVHYTDPTQEYATVRWAKFYDHSLTLLATFKFEDVPMIILYCEPDGSPQTFIQSRYRDMPGKQTSVQMMALRLGLTHSAQKMLFDMHTCGNAELAAINERGLCWLRLNHAHKLEFGSPHAHLNWFTQLTKRTARVMFLNIMPRMWKKCKLFWLIERGDIIARLEEENNRLMPGCDEQIEAAVRIVLFDDALTDDKYSLTESTTRHQVYPKRHPAFLPEHKTEEVLPFVHIMRGIKRDHDIYSCSTHDIACVLPILARHRWTPDGCQKPVSDCLCCSLIVRLVTETMAVDSKLEIFKYPIQCMADAFDSDPELLCYFFQFVCKSQMSKAIVKIAQFIKDATVKWLPDAARAMEANRKSVDEQNEQIRLTAESEIQSMAAKIQDAEREANGSPRHAAHLLALRERHTDAVNKHNEWLAKVAAASQRQQEKNDEKIARMKTVFVALPDYMTNVALVLRLPTVHLRFFADILALPASPTKRHICTAVMQAGKHSLPYGIFVALACVRSYAELISEGELLAVQQYIDESKDHYTCVAVDSRQRLNVLSGSLLDNKSTLFKEDAPMEKLHVRPVGFGCILDDGDYMYNRDDPKRKWLNIWEHRLSGVSVLEPVSMRCPYSEEPDPIAAQLRTTVGSGRVDVLDPMRLVSDDYGNEEGDGDENTLLNLSTAVTRNRVYWFDLTKVAALGDVVSALSNPVAMHLVDDKGRNIDNGRGENWTFVYSPDNDVAQSLEADEEVTKNQKKKKKKKAAAAAAAAAAGADNDDTKLPLFKSRDTKELTLEQLKKATEELTKQTAASAMLSKSKAKQQPIESSVSAVVTSDIDGKTTTKKKKKKRNRTRKMVDDEEEGGEEDDEEAENPNALPSAPVRLSVAPRPLAAEHPAAVPNLPRVVEPEPKKADRFQCISCRGEALIGKLVRMKCENDCLRAWIHRNHMDTPICCARCYGVMREITAGAAIKADRPFYYDAAPTEDRFLLLPRINNDTLKLVNPELFESLLRQTEGDVSTAILLYRNALKEKKPKQHSASAGGPQQQQQQQQPQQKTSPSASATTAPSGISKGTTREMNEYDAEGTLIQKPAPPKSADLSKVVTLDKVIRVGLPQEAQLARSEIELLASSVFKIKPAEPIVVGGLAAEPEPEPEDTSRMENELFKKKKEKKKENKRKDNSTRATNDWDYREMHYVANNRQDRDQGGNRGQGQGKSRGTSMPVHKGKRDIAPSPFNPPAASVSAAAASSTTFASAPAASVIYDEDNNDGWRPQLGSDAGLMSVQALAKSSAGPPPPLVFPKGPGYSSRPFVQDTQDGGDTIASAPEEEDVIGVPEVDEEPPGTYMENDGIYDVPPPPSVADAAAAGEPKKKKK
jgi:hypothetical protein